MVQIPVGSGKFGEVALLEGNAVQLPETAEFLPHGTTGRQVFALPPVPDGKVDQFLETGKGAYGAAFFPSFKGLQDTGWITLPGADVDDGVELYEILALFLYPEVEAPKVFLCRAVLQQTLKAAKTNPAVELKKE